MVLIPKPICFLIVLVAVLLESVVQKAEARPDLMNVDARNCANAKVLMMLLDSEAIDISTGR